MYASRGPGGMFFLSGPESEMLQRRIAGLQRWITARSRPTGARSGRHPGPGRAPRHPGGAARLVLGRRMMAETARRFLDRGIHSFILCAELSTPTLGFYDRMGEERLVDEQGQIDGAYGWRDLKALIALEPINRETP